MQTGEREGLRLEQGFAYIGLLVAVALIGVTLAFVGEVASTQAQHEREVELLFIGHQYRDAIVRFYQRNHRYPQALSELVESATDGPQPAHYLRRLYRDPMTRDVDWILLPAPGQGIMGIASSSTGVPMKRTGFDLVDLGFDDAQSYADWAFLYDPRGTYLQSQQQRGAASH